MAAIDLYDDPFQPRDRTTSMPALDWKYTAGKRQTSSPYARYTTPGYQPSAPMPAYGFNRPSATDWDRINGGMTGEPYNPSAWGGMAHPLTTPPAAQSQPAQQPFNINQLITTLQGYYPGGTMADLQRAQTEHPELFAGGRFSGSKGEKFEIGGRIYDLIRAAGAGGQGWQVLDVTNPWGSGEFSDPLTAQYETLARQRIDQLFNPLPEGPDTLSMADWMRKRAGELQANPGYSAGDREVLRTGYTDPMGAQREAAKQQVRERMAAQGVQGGLVERAMQEVDRSFDAMLAGNNRQLAQSEIQRKDQNLNTVTELRQNLAIAEQARQAFQEGRYREAIALSDQLARLPERRIALGNQTLSGGQSPSDLFSQLLNLGQAGNQSNWYNTQQNQQYMTQLFTLLSQLFR